MFAYLGGSSPVFIQGFGLTPSQFGLIFGLCSCGLIAGSQINARLLPRFGLSFMLRGHLPHLVGGDDHAAGAEPGAACTCCG